MFSRRFINLYLIRKYGIRANLIVTLDEEVTDNIKNEIYKPRHHPGIIKEKTINVPDNLVKAIECAIGDFSIKQLLQDSNELTRHLRGRKPPMERSDLRNLSQEVREKIMEKFENAKIITDEENERLKQSVNDRVKIELKKKVYNWKPINYNVHNSLVYLIGRVAPEFAALKKVFSEINIRDTKFTPRSLFDFGSGVGTATWAANQFWKKSIFEYFNVDASSDMNDLAEILLKGGRGNQAMSLKGVFYRQFLPVGNVSYDLVVSAFSLLELPSLEARIDTVLKLWNKTNQYLVIVEHGTTGGFRIINEVREFLLQVEKNHNTGYLFSPCPHEEVCPLFSNNLKCNFVTKFGTLPIGAKSETRRETCSYVVFKKGIRKADDPPWPRVIEEPLVRSKHTICRLCTAGGKLQEIIFTAKKHGKTAYHCARSTKLGDRLPVYIKDTNENSDVTNVSEQLKSNDS